MKNKILTGFIILIVGLLLFSNDYSSLFAKVESQQTNEVKTSEAEITVATDETNVCDECGRRFHGRGFNEIYNGVWKETAEPYQSFICSKSCGLRHTQKFNNSKSGYTTGNDGRIYDANACGLCNGTGIEVSRSSFGNTSRVCPMCDGRGRQSY